MPNPAPMTGTTPTQQAQQKTRDEEEAHWKRINFANAYYYKHKPKWMKPEEAISEKEQSKLAKLEGHPKLSSRTLNKGLLAPGVYRDITRDRDFDVLLEGDDKKGYTARPIPPPSSRQEFKKGYGSAMDMIASGRGGSTIVVTFDNIQGHIATFYAYRNLQMLIRMAEKRGLMLELGKGADELLTLLKPRRKQDRLRAKLSALAGNAERIKLLEGTNPDVEIKEHKDKLAKQAKMGSDADYKKALFGEGTSELQGQARLDAIQKEMAGLAQRQKDLDSARKALQSFVDGTAQVLDPQKKLLGMIQKKQIPAKSMLGQIIQSIAEGRASQEKLRFRDAAEVVAALKERIKASKPEQDALIAAIKAEEEDLKKRNAALDAELAALKARNLAAGAAKDPIEQKISDERDKIKALEARIDAENKKLDALYQKDPKDPQIPVLEGEIKKFEADRDQAKKDLSAGVDKLDKDIKQKNDDLQKIEKDILDKQAELDKTPLGVPNRSILEFEITDAKAKRDALKVDVVKLEDIKIRDGAAQAHSKAQDGDVLLKKQAVDGAAGIDKASKDLADRLKAADDELKLKAGKTGPTI